MCWYKSLLRPLVSRFIAGEHVQDAMRYGKTLRARRISPIFDYLGEAAETKEEMVRASEKYIQILDEMHAQHVKGAIALKLTAFGLDANEEACARAVSRVVRHAHALHIMVWMDMESSPYTTKTLHIYRALLQKYDNVGICIQAYLVRARKDILSLLPDKPKIRLVKGVYPERGSDVYATHTQITKNYISLLDLLAQKNAWIAIATHDEKILSHALNVKTKNHLEFQLLKGIRNDEKNVLVESGYDVWEYVPFGEKWEKYVLRRVLERWRNVWWMMQSKIGIP